MGVPFILFYYYSETTRSAFFARGTRERVCGSVDSINDSMCQQEYRRWLGSIDTCLRIQRHMHNAHLYTTRLDTTSSLGTSALRSSSFTTVPCALPGRHNTFLKLNNLGFTNVAGAPWLRYICDACMDGLTIFCHKSINDGQRKSWGENHKQCSYFHHWTEKKLNIS